MCSRKKVFVKDSMSKRKKNSFLYISLPLLSNELLWSINKLKQVLWCTIWLSYTHIYIYIYIGKNIDVIHTYYTAYIIFQYIGIDTFIIGQRTITTTTFPIPSIIQKHDKFSTYMKYYNKLSNSSPAKLAVRHCVLTDFLPNILTM